VEQRVGAAVRSSVRAHLVADVPVGVFLSAGIDSGAIAALAAESSAETTRGLTITFDEFAGGADDESPLAAEVARTYGVEHTRRVVTRAEFERDVPKIWDAMDQPTIDGINTWFVSKGARELGLKVALSGLGGDELWGGYPSFRDVPRWTRWTWLPSRMPGLGRALRSLAAPILRRSRWSPKIAGVVELGGDVSGAYLLRRGLFMPWELPALLDRDALEEGLARLRPLEYIGEHLDPDPGTDFGRVATLESALYMRNQLLRDTDWASMAHSLEVRTPLVDSVLLHEVARFTVRRGEPNSKALLARAPRTPLPRAISERRKTGFTTPIAAWLLDNRELDAWRSVPSLARPGCHWSRRLGYATLRHFLGA
jgi:asparagine synthase (glutamine-hydrolysing)